MWSSLVRTRQERPMSICSARSDWSGHILGLSFSPTKVRRRMLSPPCASGLFATSRSRSPGRCSQKWCWDDGIEVVSATPDWIRLAARCDRKTADRLVQFFREIADLPDAEKYDVAIALREMLLNAIEHGGRLDPNQYVEVSYLRARHMVLCRVKDPGDGFSLDEIRHAAIANPPDDPIRHQSYRDELGLRPGGFGVLLTQKLVDELIYGEKGNE